MKNITVEGCLTCPLVRIVGGGGSPYAGACTATNPYKELEPGTKANSLPEWCPLEDETKIPGKD
jgi:hypothetical protein